ncbi:MAG: hypothetical protein IJK77_07850 [Lachnospiraceae bacterium]|nr:hypothetical protein [Lachnospiraceae bacterium]
MKNQYIGDIGDYGKYGLLRFLAERGIKIGINWYLTENDGSNDGGFTYYLKNKDDSDKDYDPIVYFELKRIVEKYERDQKDIRMIEVADLIPDALFFNDQVDSNHTDPQERARARYLWYYRSKLALKDAELVFADPDNGVSYTKTSRNKGCEKFILPEEIAQYYYDGKDVVFYCHKGRRKDEAWERTKVQIKDYVCDARLFVLTFHRGTQRSYIFVVHPEHADRYEVLLTEFLSTLWGQEQKAQKAPFTLETVEENATEKATPEQCRRWAVLNYFQKAFPTKQEKELILSRMTDEQIDKLTEAGANVHGKSFYASFKKKGTGFAAPTIGVVCPKDTSVVHNDDGTITLVPPSDQTD